MGKKKSIIKVVLDTNVLISALLFRKDLANIVDLWKAGTIVPVLSKDTFKELITVLQYPKFSLTKQERHSIIYEEILPFFEITEVKNVI